jgi:hypothetical protein
VGTAIPMRWRPQPTKVSSPKRVVGLGVAVSHALAGGACGTAQACSSALSRLRVALARTQKSLALSVCNAASDIALHDWQDGGHGLVTEATHSFRPAAVRPSGVEQLLPRSQAPSSGRSTRGASFMSS